MGTPEYLTAIDRKLDRVLEAARELEGLQRLTRCDVQQDRCERQCAVERDRALARIDESHRCEDERDLARSQCGIAEVLALRECNALADAVERTRCVEEAQAALASCQRPIEVKFNTCVAAREAVRNRIEERYDACVRACADSADDCRRESIRDHDRPDLPREGRPPPPGRP